MCEEAVGWRMKMAEQNNQQKKGGQQQDANQLIQVRYDKLHELNREEDIWKAIKDVEYRKKLLEEFHLD